MSLRDEVLACESVVPRSYSHLYGIRPYPLELRVFLTLVAIEHDAREDAPVEGCSA